MSALEASIVKSEGSPGPTAIIVREPFSFLGKNKFDKDKVVIRLKELVKKEEEILSDTFMKPRVHS